MSIIHHKHSIPAVARNHSKKKSHFPPLHHLSSGNHLVLDVQVDILVDIVVLQLLAVPAHLEQLINASLVKVRLEVTLVLGQDLGLGLLTAETVAQRSLDNDLLEDGAVVEGDGQRVGDGALGGVVVVSGELLVLDTADALAEVLDQRGGGGLGAIGVVVGSQAVEGQHGSDHVLKRALVWRNMTIMAAKAYLNTVVAVGKVVHLLELLINDTDAGLVGAVGDLLDVLGALAHFGQLLVDDFGGLNGSLGVELGWQKS